METVFSLAKLRSCPSPIATIGVFDGVHRGHRQVLAETVRWAREVDGAAVVITFGRHPERVLAGASPDSITSLEHKLHLVAQTDVDLCVVLHFDRALANMPPERFVCETLVDALSVTGVVLGYNARFGRGGAGDAALLARMGREHGFETRTVGPLELDGAPVSSTRIRKLIENGDLGAAARLLGRPFTLRGTVVHGDKRGRDLGFPTANLNLHHEATPPRGVYICRASLDGAPYWGMVNIGVRPTFSTVPGGETRHVEVYLEDYAGDGLYGETVEIEPVKFLRDERCFESPEALALQLGQDRRALRTFRGAGDESESA